ncbi:hypothetical protein CTAYLR_001765 [Chrysophaeum taylorii]|uniref:DM10 domain-containing protein n=1 Tax=Chrysophaeum taylorii TaxID=2483200 RepID=A0AAD7UFD1_9STRA|nr:hypothetical protein CTAYLR_001765 [Chrysophaeum taylorii]
MRYAYSSSNSEKPAVEMPMVPGLTFQTDQWHRRAVTTGGFKKPQLLAQEWTLAMPSDSPRARTARGSPRVAKLTGASARHDEAIALRPATTVSIKRPAFSRKVTEKKAASSETQSAFASKDTVERAGVLRFAAYVTNSMDWYGERSPRQVRKFRVQYHLEDGSVEVVEDRVVNSGVSGGVFFRRAPSPTTWESLRVGGTFEFLGQQFHLVDADGFTRQYYEENGGIEQPPGTGYPRTCPEEYRAEHATHLGKTTGKVSYGKYGGIEVFRTSPEAASRNAQMAKERQFFSSNDEVLKFVVVWRDDAPGGGPNEFTLHYHASTQIAELLASPRPGFGRFTHLASNRRLLLNWEAVARTGAPPKYAQPEDFVVGRDIDVYNRTLTLVDCSEFTRAWYKATLGIDQPPRIRRPENNQQQDAHNNNNKAVGTGGAAAGAPSRSPRPAIAPKKQSELVAIDEKAVAEAARLALSNPFCANEATKKSLVTKQHELSKKTRLGDKVVRCRLRQVVTAEARERCPGIARALDALPRTFVATYFLADDEAVVFEDRVTNSGILGGAFLKKGKYEVCVDDDHRPRRLQPQDFKLGAVLKFSANNCLKVVEIDAASLKTMAALPDIFPSAHPPTILAKLKDLDDAQHDTDLDDHERLVLKTHQAMITGGG